MEVQTPLPPPDEPDTASELASLRLLIQDTERNILAFGLFQSTAEREAAIRSLRQDLTLPFYEFVLSPAAADAIALLQSLPSGPRACVCFYDLEAALPDAAGFLNLRRDELTDVPHAVVFWVGEHGLRELARLAPDFWAWRSGVFDFRSPEPQVRDNLARRVAAEALSYHDRADLERRISLYQGLIQEHSTQEQPDHRFIGELELRLSQVLEHCSRLDEAEGVAKEALARARNQSIAQLEARALSRLAWLKERHWQLSEAETFYNASRDIFNKIEDEHGVAGAIYGLGNVFLKRRLFDQAEAAYQDAAALARRQGNELGVGAAYHQLGMVAQERHDFPAAEVWYQKALEIETRLGSEYNIAITYRQLGIAAQKRHDFSAAEAWYQKALEIEIRLGDELGTANTCHQLGLMAQAQRDFTAAEAWHQKSLEIRRRLGDKHGAASTYHQLGRVAEETERLSEAAAYFQRAETLMEKLHDADNLTIIRRSKERVKTAQEAPA